MTSRTLRSSVVTALALCAVACGEPAQTRGNGETGDTDGASDDSSSGTTPTPTTATTNPTSATTDPTDATESGDTTADPSETDADDTGEDGEFQFDQTDPSEYTRIDRVGVPGVSTMLVGDPDAYNLGSPTDDVDAVFSDEILARLASLNEMLADDLVDLGLTQCEFAVCANQTIAVVIPDVLRVDLTEPPGFPNGRMPADPVIDIMLAVMLLDLTEHFDTAFADLPLNPAAGDEPPLAEFPYLAAPH